MSVCVFRHKCDQRKLSQCCLCLTTKHLCGHSSLVVCIFAAGVHVFRLWARWFPSELHFPCVGSNGPWYPLFIQSFSHHVICQSHQIILYERHLWHICPWKACLQSLNIDPRGLSRGASHECRKRREKNRSLVILIRWSVKLRLPDVSVCIWVDGNPSHNPLLSPWASGTQDGSC